jgi:hypothetical protein
MPNCLGFGFNWAFCLFLLPFCIGAPLRVQTLNGKTQMFHSLLTRGLMGKTTYNKS